jgi:phosphomannomutase
LRSHLERLLAAVQVDAIRRCHFNVLLDANHGAGGGLGRLLLDALGCNVTVLGGQADGQFAHPPEPTAENLTTVLPAVNAHGADIGFCQDPDADRLAIIDGQGRYLGEEYTQAICFDHVLARRRGPIVTNGASSRMALDIARRHGTVCHRSPVGEAHVVELMIAQRAILGGEGNGGVIDPRVGYVRDSFVGMALVLEAMALGGQTVAELADRLPRYAMIKTTAAVPVDRLAAVLEALRSHFAAAQADDTDGLRLDWLDRWLLVRASNTEPLVRLIAEAPTPEEVEGLREEALGVIRKATA